MVILSSYIGRAGLSSGRPGFAPALAYMGFVVDNVALGLVFLASYSVFPVSIIPPWLSKLMYHVEDEQ
jgi:hypothetical protein